MLVDSCFMIDVKCRVSADNRLSEALCRISFHSCSMVWFDRQMWGSTHAFMFLGGWFLVRHISIKVLWWLAFAIEISIPFSFVPSSCRGSGCCSVSEDVPCLVVGPRFWIASSVPCTVVLRIPSKVI